eukprot:3054933-Prymnesium_polylepis.1
MPRVLHHERDLIEHVGAHRAHARLVLPLLLLLACLLRLSLPPPRARFRVALQHQPLDVRDASGELSLARRTLASSLALAGARHGFVVPPRRLSCT